MLPLVAFFAAGVHSTPTNTQNSAKNRNLRQEGSHGPVPSKLLPQAQLGAIMAFPSPPAFHNAQLTFFAASSYITERPRRKHAFFASTDCCAVADGDWRRPTLALCQKPERHLPVLTDLTSTDGCTGSGRGADVGHVLSAHMVGKSTRACCHTAL